MRIWDTGVRGLTRALATLPKVTRSISGQRQVWETSRWALGEQVRGIWYFFPSVLWHC